MDASTTINAATAIIAPLPQVRQYHTIHLGCDPEFFFQRGGKVIGSERVLDAKPQAFSPMSVFVIDGVQAELNPSPSTCRESLATNIASAFFSLQGRLAQLGDVTACFTAVVDVEKAELDTLSDKAKVFGCAPSLNAAGKQSEITVDPQTYLKRSAGGHIHLGLDLTLKKEATRMVPIFDCLVGLPFVMIERDDSAIERRKVYGRAGEYRLPLHGIEYRTPSNVWLRAYPLMSLIMALARQSAHIIGTSLATHQMGGGWDAEGALLKRVDMNKVQLAINTNDVTLAREQFEGVAAFLHDHVERVNSGLGRNNLKRFYAFCTHIEQEGLASIFPKDPLAHWTQGYDDQGGWESFINSFSAKKLAKST